MTPFLSWVPTTVFDRRRLHIQSRFLIFSPKIRAVYSSATLLVTYHITHVVTQKTTTRSYKVLPI